MNKGGYNAVWFECEGTQREQKLHENSYISNVEISTISN